MNKNNSLFMNRKKGERRREQKQVWVPKEWLDEIRTRKIILPNGKAESDADAVKREWQMLKNSIHNEDLDLGVRIDRRKNNNV